MAITVCRDWCVCGHKHGFTSLDHHARYRDKPRITSWVCADCLLPARMAWLSIMSQAPGFE